MILTITSGMIAYGSYTLAKEIGRLYNEYKRDKNNKKK